jgi:hypothetical protein
MQRAFRERSARSALTQQQREAMHFHAVALLARITQVHSALKEGDMTRAERIGGEFDEDRLLLKVLTMAPADCEAALSNPTADLRRSLVRLRACAAAELREYANLEILPSSQAEERAQLTVDACDSLLGAAS